MKRYYILLLGLCMMSSIQAQDSDPRKAFDRFAQRSKQKFDDFRSRANEQYAEAMKRAWERFNAQPAVPRPKDETVPPVVLPEEDRDKPIETRPVPIKDVVTPPTPAPQPEPVSPVEERPQPKDQTVGFVYCGTKLEVRMNASSRPRLSSCDNDALAAAWSRLAKDDALNNTLRDCLDLRQELQLCDWAYLNMIHALAQKAFGESNEATLLTAYLYCQSGYQMRLARNSERVVLLFASNHAIYNSGYYRLENTNFYPFGGEEPLLEICDAKFPKEQPMSLLIPRAQQLAQQPSTPRTLTSKRYDDISVTTSVNKNMIDFYDSYPTSERWLSLMAKGFIGGNVVIGYCGIEIRKGFANRMIRCNRLATSVRYLAAAIRGRAYRGISHNIGYTKSLYFAHKGFNHLNMNIGDDDLFIQTIATPTNVSIIMNPHATVRQMQYGGLGWWHAMRKTLTYAFRYYPRGIRTSISFELWSRMLFFLTAIAAIILLPPWWKIIPALFLLLRLLIVELKIWRIGKRLGERKLAGTYILYDLTSPLGECFLALSRRLRPNRAVWR